MRELIGNMLSFLMTLKDPGVCVNSSRLLGRDSIG